MFQFGLVSLQDKPASRLTQLASSKGPSRNGPGRQTKAEIRAQDHNLLAILVPGSSLEYKMIAAISVIRFGIVPMASWMAVRICARLGLLPADHVCVLAILIQVSYLAVTDAQRWSYNSFDSCIAYCI